ncbi:MAG: rhodanese-like domain-containing protein [Saprospiraceae bacterium]
MYIAITILVLLAAFFLLKGGKSNINSSINRVSPNEAKVLLKDKNTVLLDVRTPAEVSQGKIKGAKTLNVASTGFITGLKSLDKSKNYVVYCRSGRRSMRACSMMASNGFDNLNNLEGGYNAWS